MTTTTRFMASCCAALLTASALSVTNLVAQAPGTVAPAAAIKLETKAEGWLGAPNKWSGVARALERAAEIRGAEDPAAVSDLFLAAAARMWIGQHAHAQAVYVKAAEWALATGDVETAATGYTRAAVIAFEANDIAAARELRGKATRLAHSPLLSAAQREFIMSQFATGATSVAAGR